MTEHLIQVTGSKGSVCLCVRAEGLAAVVATSCILGTGTEDQKRMLYFYNTGEFRWCVNNVSHAGGKQG